VTKQATETSSSNAYITTEDHLAELSDSKKIVIPQMYCYAAYNSHVGNRGISVYCIDVTGFNSLKIDSVTVENINTGSYVVITGVSGTTNTQLYETSGADSSISTIDISNYDTINFTIDVQSTGQHGACMYINNIVIQ
jgi:hypothetical protein